MSYVTSKDENSSLQLTGEKTIWYNVFREEMMYIDIGYKSAHKHTERWRKDTKDMEATLI